MNSPAAAGTQNVSLATQGPPPEFDELASPREALVDVYFGGRKIAETLALTAPGTLRFRAPSEVLRGLPQIIDGPELTAALADALPTNSDAVCSVSNAGQCGLLQPPVLGIIYDDERFRVDLFVNPRFLRTAHTGPQGYLPTPQTPLSVTSALALNLSGTTSGASVYNLQNRTIVGWRNARLRADSSVASRLGFVVDDILAEVDEKDLRYSAGLFWAPGNEFTGQRRIAGAGVGTQFDTWADRQALRGTPLILFLAQPARVELLVDGRLMSSRAYAAGNVEIDASALPDGSYPVLLRVHLPDGSVREEHRFFVRNAQIAPAGHPIFYAYAGLLANTRRDRPISVSHTIYYQAGTAWRLSNGLALDGALLGTQHKAIVQAGAWLIHGPLRLRAAGLVSTAGDAGALVQLGTAGHGPLNVSLDVRRIWSSDGEPLIPLAATTSTFDATLPVGLQRANGSYTQATGNIGLRLGSAYLNLVGSYREDRDLPADYTIGPSLNWPVITRNRFQIVLDASAQRARTTTAAFAGLRLLLTSGHMSVLGTLGHGYQDDDSDGDDAQSRIVGSLSAQYSHEYSDRSLLNLEAGLDRNISASTVHAGGSFYSRFGGLRGDLLHDLEGGGGVQYDVALQSGFAIGGGGAALGARDMEQSAILVSVNGDAPDALFNVLVDDALKGQVRAGQRLPLFVPPYRTYNVRLVPAGTVPVSYDTAAREVTLYPGNVQSLAWHAERYFTVFGQAVSVQGAPIANALVQTGKGIAETDGNGYFQVDAAREDPITIARTGERACSIILGAVAVKDDFASIGKAVCK